MLLSVGRFIQHVSEETSTSIGRRMDTDAVYKHYDGHKKNEIMPFAATWMDTETITLSEESQRKTVYASLTGGI